MELRIKEIKLEPDQILGLWDELSRLQLESGSHDAILEFIEELEEAIEPSKQDARVLMEEFLTEYMGTIHKMVKAIYEGKTQEIPQVSNRLLNKSEELLKVLQRLKME